MVTRSTGKDGKDEVATDHIKMPADLYNGLVTPVIKNVSPDAGETKVSMIVAAPKPRVVTLNILPQAPETFYLAGFPSQVLGLRNQNRTGRNRRCGSAHHRQAAAQYFHEYRRRTIAGLSARNGSLIRRRRNSDDHPDRTHMGCSQLLATNLSADPPYGDWGIVAK